MGRACCILGCPSGGDAPSHQIPKNPTLFKKWKDIIYSEKIQHLTDEQISKCTVCYRHFSEDDYLATFRVRKLKRGIAPSLNLPNKHPNNDGPVKIKSITESQIPDTSTSTSTTETEMTKCQNAVTEKLKTEKLEIALFEDVPEEVKSCLPKQSEQISSNKDIKKIDSTTEIFKLYCRKRALKRKRAKLTVKQLALLQRKKQAEYYKKTPTIQKLLSFLTPAEIASVETKVQKSKYSPKTYVRLYHDIAKRKALDQL